MGHYVLGVDGGGTKTHAALFDIKGNKIDFVEWGATNHEVLGGGCGELKEILLELITHLAERNNLHKSEIKFSVLGLAGVDTEIQHAEISKVIKECGLEDFILCNDAFLGVKAGCEKGAGICAINGTGCTVAGIDSQGRMLQIGGMGELSGDHGGGRYLGIKAIASVYDSLFRNGTETLMSEILFNLLNIDTKYRFVQAVAEAVSQKKFSYKDLNKVVFSAANRSDKVALDILEKMGAENARSINAMIRALNFQDPVQIVFTGSIYAKGENSAALDRIRKDVQDANKERELSFTLLEKPPAVGAVFWALEEAGAETGLYQKVLSDF